MKRKRALRIANWRRLSLAFLAIAAAIALLSVKLTSLAPSLSPIEKSTLHASSSGHLIIANPLHLPLKALLWLLGFASPHYQLLAARLPSVLFGLLSLLLFIYVLPKWYGQRATVFGFVLFVTSAWFLHISRFAGTDIEYLLAMLSLLALHIRLHKHAKRPGIAYLWLITNIMLVFIPGLVWFVLLQVAWDRTEVIAIWQALIPLWHRILWIAIAVIGLGSLAYSLFSQHYLLSTWLGLPNHTLTWQSIASNLSTTVSALVYHGPHLPELWLSNLPLLDAFTAIMLVAGIVFYTHHWRANRTRLLLSYLVLSIILISLGGSVRLSLMVPIIYVVAIGGIAYVLHVWLSVFPRNPLARTIGITVVALVVALSCAYNLSQYFIAWPHNRETLSVYESSNPIST